VRPIVQEALRFMRTDPELASALGQADVGQLEEEILKAAREGITRDAGQDGQAVQMQTTMRSSVPKL
jgi:hypothetical protein